MTDQPATSAATFALVEVQSCCTEFTRVIAVGTEAEMRALFNEGQPDTSDDGYDLFVTEVGRDR